MAEEQEDTPMRTEEEQEKEDEDEDENEDHSVSGSGNGSGSESEKEQVEWLATTREKRATAGNRLASLLQQEEPDDELELLFQEDEDDVGFEDAEDASDVQMDSSSDDEDQGPTAGDGELDGEKEIQRQDRAERQAKKRKLAQVPGLKRKKVKIDPRIPQAPAPRPKKKSERASWLPTAEEAPTRASARKTTKLSKEQLHQQMVEREIKRLKQLANMEKAAAAKEAAKKPAMTQADRLAEAARVEKSNAKSLSRWEESENLREEQQREKLAALQNRHLEGPVITWWSGMAEWIGGTLRKVGKNLTLEDKERTGRKRKAAELEADEEAGSVVAGTKPEDESVTAGAKPEGGSEPSRTEGGLSITSRTAEDEKAPANEATKAEPSKPMSITDPKKPEEETSQPNRTEPNASLPIDVPEETTPRELDAVSSPITEEAPPHVTPAPIPGPPRSSFLAPPAGLPLTAPPPPPPKNSTANPLHPSFILAPPNLDGSAPLLGFGYNFMQRPPLMPAQATPYAFNPTQPPPVNLPPPPPAIEHAARNYLILQNFDETAVKEKGVQTQILFGRKFDKVRKSKHAHELCAITGYPAKYRDPCTGLPYCNSYAYKEIQRLKRGDYKWSKLVGAYMGQGTYAARGVPPRFLNALSKPAQTTPQQPGK